MVQGLTGAPEGAALAALVLRGAGIVGHRKGQEQASTISGDTIREEKAQQTQADKDS